MLKRVLTLACAFCAVSSVSQAAVVNGDFSAGLSGYSVTGGPANAAEISDNAGNPFLEVDSFSRIFGDIAVEVSQSFMIDTLAPVLSFDAGLIFAGDDPALQSGFDFGPDVFSVLLDDGSGGNIPTLFTIDEAGASLGNTFPDPSRLSIETLPGGFFDYHFTADLSGYIGQTVELTFLAFSFPDGRISSYGVDNIALSAAPVAAVPLPASLPLSLAGIALLGAVSRRRRGVLT